MIGVDHSVVRPCEDDESRKSRGEKPRASERECCSSPGRFPARVKFNVQSTNAVGVFRFGKEFE
jgi:hypothetical protein